ncbi:hypothetical protein CIB95_02610 [Lottiidibacillus patelloidae]|uniref:YlbE-like protein n=1 Tax=Lottiidibacillus patelloidae TaxID=2670334 RepID=A0A263BY11_9BACI|nr:YlbE-like family protein [Lottiidibacillus patelloidae]OZM58478.1 hypothetical protein CIB95_02610 [Lottiidibacillus patelloidae]
MNKQVQNYIYSNSELNYFIRMNPIWYRRLAREPEEIQNFEAAAKQFYGKTIPQRVNKVNEKIQSLGMMFELLKALGQNQND